MDRGAWQTTVRAVTVREDWVTKHTHRKRGGKLCQKIQELN